MLVDEFLPRGDDRPYMFEPAGQIYIRQEADSVPATRDDIVRLVLEAHGEKLNADGTVDQSNIATLVSEGPFQTDTYILNGKGYDVHDGQRYDWRAGDAAIVENACVHQHFNADPDEEARVLVMKAKPLFLFFNLLFQKTVELPPKEATPGHEGFRSED